MLTKDKKGRKIPEKYLAGLSSKLRAQRVAELTQSRDAYWEGNYSELPSDITARKLGLVKQSAYTTVAKERGIEWRGDPLDMSKRVFAHYGVRGPVKEFAKALKQSFDKGLAAWKSGGHRPGATAQNWAVARVHSLVVGGKTAWTADRKQFAVLPKELRRRIIQELPEVYAALRQQDRQADVSYIRKAAKANPVYPPREGGQTESGQKFIRLCKDYQLDASLKKLGVKVILHVRQGEDTVHLEHIEADQKGTGAGSEAVDLITEIADLAGVKLTLNVVGYAVPSHRLVGFYRRFGFDVDDTEEDEDEGLPMLRYPRTAKTNPETPVNGAGLVIMDNKNRVLLLRRGPTAPWMPGVWNLPSGLNQSKEDYVSTAIREAEEETNLDIFKVRPIGVIDSGLGWAVAYFKSLPGDWEGRVKLDYENDAHVWVRPAELDKFPLIPTNKQAILAAL